MDEEKTERVSDGVMRPVSGKMREIISNPDNFLQALEQAQKQLHCIAVLLGSEWVKNDATPREVYEEVRDMALMAFYAIGGDIATMPEIPLPSDIKATMSFPKEVEQSLRLAHKHLEKVCEHYTDHENHRRHCEYCPLNWHRDTCLCRALRFLA